MIAIERGPCPRSLAGFSSAGGIERARALEFFSDRERRERTFSFRAYKEDDVKAALAAMFGSKCAYCESDVRAVGPPDVEHYRPKAAIEIGGRRHRPGYYWLASDWENLLPSCYDCNRRRYQETTSGRRLSGKGNAFPLKDESRRAAMPGDEAHEEPQLIDPCRDDPTAHLEFLPEGAIRAAEEGNGASSECGEVTIEVLGLDRLDLCSGRREHAIVVERAIKHFKRASKQLEQDPESPEAQLELEEEMEELRRLIDPKSRYAGLARQMISRELGQLELPLDR